MSVLTYGEKLKYPRWQKKRLEIFDRDNWTCQSCDRVDLTLNIHHLKYLPGAEPWNYDNALLITYCELCHNTEHLIGDQIHESLIEIVRDNRLLIKPISQLCILAEKWPEFAGKVKEFMTESMISYLKTCKPLTDVSRLDKAS